MSTPVLHRRAPRPSVPPRLDADQQRVVDHPGGPLLVLAGPGTGKTTTLVEAVVARVDRGLPAESVLLLTFSRRAAQELRSRVTARLGRHHPRPGRHDLPRLRLRAAAPRAPPTACGCSPGPSTTWRSAGCWPPRSRPAAPAGPRRCVRRCRSAVSGRSCGTCSCARRSAGWTARCSSSVGTQHGRAGWVAAGSLLTEYEGRFDLEPGPEVLDHGGAGARRGRAAPVRPGAARAASARPAPW